jgi:outer membrane protein assembly factor BamB
VGEGRRAAARGETQLTRDLERAFAADGLLAGLKKYPEKELGAALLVFGSGDGWIYAIQPRTGRQIWEYQFSRRGINTGPLVVGNKIYAGHSEENVVGQAMGAVALLNGGLQGNITKSGEEWKVEEQH